METVNYVLSGLGGQGILFMTRILAETALRKGLPFMGAETHGMAQRGGSVVSHLRIGHVEGSLVRAGTARFLLALEENEAYRSLPFLAGGGSLYVNAAGTPFPRTEVAQYLQEAGIGCRAANVAHIAASRGAPGSSNLALLGFFAAFGEGPLGHDAILETVGRITPERFRENNIRIFEAGYQEGAKVRGERGLPWQEELAVT